jgi:probable phosphoglycerate mutase
MEPKESKLNGPPLPALSSIGKRLFLVRHGEVINPGGERSVYYGAMDVPLSSLGELEAQVAGEYLSQFKLSKVFSSPLSRAIYGAGEVLKRQSHHDCLANQEVIILDGFKELDRGDWCGKTKEEIGADLMARFDACDETVTPNNGESYLTLKQRVTKALETTLAQMDQGSAACIVSHLQVTRCLLSDALGIPTGEMVNLKVATASVTCIDYENGVPTVMYQSYKPDAELVASTDGAN